jgi:hypothetical protein
MPEIQEFSAKKELIKSLLKCPHRNLDETVVTFSEALEADPMFAGKCFYALTLEEFNQIRDLAEAGIAFLLTSPHADHREAGRCTLQRLEPYRAYRVSAFVRSSLKVNRQVTGAVVDYLHMLEQSPRRFDGAARLAGRDLHRMYEFFHVKPGERAQKILFENKRPEGEVDILEQLKNASTPDEQAAIIVKEKIPYRIATSVVKAMTPSVMVALINVMTPAEAINTRASIEKTGILGDPDVRLLYESKLKAAIADSRVSTTTISGRKSAQGKDSRLTDVLKTVEQTKIDRAAKITTDTAIFVDTSGSMERAIEVAKKICPVIASMCIGKLVIYGFNDTGYKIEFKGTSIEDFRKAFSMVRPNGNTSLGAPLDLAIKKGFLPEQAVYITDQGENRGPMLEEVYKNRAKEVKFVFINVGSYRNQVTLQLERAGAEVTEFDFNTTPETPGWYVNLNNLTTLLTKGGYTDLVERIVSLELPKRRDK